MRTTVTALLFAAGISLLVGILTHFSVLPYFMLKLKPHSYMDFAQVLALGAIGLGILKAMPGGGTK